MVHVNYLVCSLGEEPGPSGRRVTAPMKGIAYVIGVLVIIVLLVSSGVVGGALCINELGCIATNSDGISIDNRESVTIVTGNP